MSAVSCLKEKREAAEGIAKLLVPGLAQSLGSSHATEEAVCGESFMPDLRLERSEELLGSGR